MADLTAVLDPQDDGVARCRDIHQVVTTMPESSRLRFCDHCWQPVAVGTVFWVFRHADLSAALSYGGPACTGAAVTGGHGEEVA